jgi:hypothetical protein
MNLRRLVAVAVLLLWTCVAVLAQTVGQSGRQVAGPSHRDANGVLTSTSAGPPQPMLVGGTVRADTTIQDLSMDASGNLKTAESAPAFDQNGLAQDIILNSAMTVGAAGDSCAPIDTHRYRIVGLMIKVVPSTGVGGINRLAIQIRAHLNGASDSSSVFAWYPQASSNMGAGVAAAGADVDTLFRIGHLITPAQTTLGSGEFSVVANRVRNAPGDGVAATAWSYPSGMYLMLSTFFGTDLWAPYISVRVRNMVGPTCKVTVHLVGSPL